LLKRVTVIINNCALQALFQMRLESLA
jgi:hypothetical protein